jgi:hypothetical protein
MLFQTACNSDRSPLALRAAGNLIGYRLPPRFLAEAHFLVETKVC